MANPGYTRRQELVCTLDELNRYSQAVLYVGETLYVKQTDGTYAVKIGDGVTPVGDLPYVINYSEIHAASMQALAARDKAQEIADGIGVVQNTGNSPTAVMSQKAVTGCFDTLKNEKALPERLEYESGLLSGDTGEPYASSLGLRTKDFFSVDCEILKVKKEYAALIICEYDSNGVFLNDYYWSYTVTEVTLPVYPNKKYKLAFTNYEGGKATSVTNVEEFLGRIKIFQKNEQFITEKEFDRIGYVKHDLTVGRNSTLIRLNGEEVATDKCWTYWFNNDGFSKVKVYSRTVAETIAVVAFYSGTDFISATPSKEFYGIPLWYELDVPQNCTKIAITVGVSTESYTPEIFLSLDGYHNNLTNLSDLFINEDDIWED
jgi:hypothetical protein